MDEQFNLLFQTVETGNFDLAEDRIVDITNNFLEDLEQGDAELYILTVFNRESGIIAFIKKAAAKVKGLQGLDKPVKKALELIYTLIKDFPLLVSEYQDDILKICDYISHAGSYLSKAKALETMEMIFMTPKMNPTAESIDKIWKILEKKISENNDTVYRKALVIMGTLIKKKPDSITGEARLILLKRHVNNLSRYSNQKTIMESTFKVITNFLYCTDLSEDLVGPLYNQMEKYCVYTEENKYNQHKNKVANRSALDLLAQHAGLFSIQMLNNADQLEHMLKVWLGAQNADNLKSGIKALDAFYKELGEVLKIRRGIEYAGLCERIVNDLERQLCNKSVHSNVMRVYIRGLGYFAGAAEVHLPNRVGNLFIIIKQQIEFGYELSPIDKLKDLENLPDYLFALSNYISVLKVINRNHEVALQKVAVFMVRIFPRLSSAHHNLATDTFFVTMYSVFTKTGSVKFELFLKDVIEGCIKWSCSHYVAQEVEYLIEDGSEHFTFKQFMPFWLGVLNWCNLSRYRIPEEKVIGIKNIFFSELMRTLFTLIEKLNISIRVKEGRSNQLDPAVRLEATKKSDYNILVNLCDLYVELMGNVAPLLFKKWIRYFFHHILKKCFQHPLISGFYKLIAAGLKLSDQLDYFDERRLAITETNNCFRKLVKLVQLLLVKIREYKDDLQIACIKTILSAPMTIIDQIDADFADLYTTSFIQARSDYPLGIEAINAIERWNKHKNVKPLLMKILPALDPILRSHTLLSKKTETTVAKSRKNFRKRRIVVETGPELLELQRKILCLLAKMDSDVCWEYVNANAQITPVISSENQYLQLQLFDDKLHLYLDKLVPRVVDLALTCSDRKVQFTACQLLHAITMIMLGTFSEPADGNSDQNEMFKTIISAILPLAVDNDKTISDLFSPLSIELVHWYASQKQLGSKQAQIVLEILLEAISNPKDAKVRDLAGSNLKEFVNWSRRAKKNANHYNVGEIVNTLKYFSTHPDNSKRLGAALIFNNIYTELREEEYFINLYWLDLLGVFVSNLSSIHDRSDDDSLRQVKLALDNILRVLVERHVIFNKPVSEEQRPIPPGFSGNTMKDVAAFLLQKTNSLSTHSRLKCMELYSNVLKVDFTGKRELIQSNPFKPEFYEHQLLSSDCSRFDEHLKWLNSLICSIDGHIFALSNKMVICGNLEESKLFISLNYYLQHSARKTLSDFNSKTISVVKIAEFEYSRNLLVEKNLLLARILLENNYTPRIYFNENFCRFICDCIFNHYTLGLHIMDEDENEAKLNQLITILPNDIKHDFFVEAKLYISTNFHKHQRGLLRGALFLLKSNLINSDITEIARGSVRQICSGLIGSNCVQAVHHSLLEKQNLLLEIALENPDEFLALTNYLCDARIMTNSETNEEVRFGLHLLYTYRSVLIKFIFRRNNFEIFISKLLNIEAPYICITDLIALVLSNVKCYDEDTRKYIVEVLTGHWDHFDGYYLHDLERCDLGLKLVEQLAFLQGCGNAVLLDWVLKTLLSTLDSGHGKDQQFDFFNQRIYTLALVAGVEEDSRIREALKQVRTKYADILNKPSNLTSTTLLIKTYFEAANCSKSCDILIDALHLHISTKNDYQPKTVLEHFFKNVVPSAQTEMLRRVYSNMGNNVVLIENFTTLLTKCNYEVFENFYVEMMKSILANLETGKAAEKVISCLLLEAFFYQVNTDKFENKSCPITLELFGKGNVLTGKELLNKILPILLNVCKEDEPEAEVFLKPFRMYQCYAYKALASMICHTEITNDKFYRLLFNRENIMKEDILWSKMIGKETSFNFDIQNKETFSYKVVIVNIRSKNEFTNDQYIESQNLFSSSLCEGIGRHDFTHAMVRSQTQPETDNPSTSRYSRMQIQLTNEDIDQHPCMASVRGIIKHLHENNLLSSLDDTAPLIVGNLRDILMKDSTLPVVKVFLVKVIESSRTFLKEQGKWLIGPVMKVVGDGCAGECINSFVADVMGMLLVEWSDVQVLAQDKERITELITFIMRNLYNEDYEIFKNNLYLLKFSVEKWKDDFIVPTDLILDKLNEANNETGKIQVVVHIINILLVNNLQPWKSNMKVFFKKLLGILVSNPKTVYIQCAETLGLILKYISESELLVSKLEIIIPFVKQEIGNIKDIDKMAYCLEGFSKHYPDICRNYLTRIIDCVADKNMNTGVLLRILMKCSKLGFDASKLLTLLEKSDVDVLVITLEIVKNFVGDGESEQIIQIIKKVKSMLNSNNNLIRSGVYDVCIATYQRFKFEGEIGSMAKDVLVQGLVDTYAILQERILNFWLEFEDLPQDMEARLIYLLQNVYKPEIEEYYLGFTTLIMLSNLKTNTSERLFNHPLHKCNYAPLELSTHWKAQHSSQVPLFTSTLSSQAEILATQTPQFEPTATFSSQKNKIIEGSSSLLTGTLGLFKNPNQYSISQKYRVFRKRFNKDLQVTRKFFATQNVQKNFSEKKARVDAAKKRDRTVQIYRKYRVGDYPDIEIAKIDVLRPLQELSKQDPLVARKLFTMIFDSIKSSNQRENFLTDASRAIDGIFRNSNNHTTMLMAAFLDIAIKYKNMRFDVRVISTVSQNARLMSLGATLLEEYLIDLDPCEEVASKRAKGINNDYESVLWIKLAELYKEMDDWDVVRTIFLEKLKCSESSLKAIELEALGKWKSASTEYKHVISEDNDPDRRDFYFESLFRCLSELSNWSELVKHTEEVVSTENPWNALWEDEWNRRKLLPGYITAKIRESVEKPETRSNFLELITTDLKDPNRGPYMKDNYSEQLAFLSVLQNNFSHSKVYLDAYINNFLQNWSSLNPLFTMIRGKNIISMRNAMDIYLFINHHTSNNDDFTDFNRFWNSSCDDKSVSIVVAETRNFYRKEFAKHLKIKCDDAQKALIDDTLFNLDLKLTESSLRHDNYYMARKYIDMRLVKNTKLGLKNLQSSLLNSKICHLFAKLSAKHEYKQISEKLRLSFQTTDKCLKNGLIKSHPMLMLDTALHLFNTCNYFYEASHGQDDTEQLNNTLRQLNFSSKDDVRKHGEDSLQRALSECEKYIQTPELVTEIANCYYKLALCVTDRDEAKFIHFTLMAMFYQSQEAVNLLPCLLNIEGLVKDYRNVFREESTNIPVWMFIKWIPQLLSFVDTDKVDCITEIIIKIAMQYPNSIIYAYNISKMHYKFEHALKELSQDLCTRLDSILKNATVEKMLSALGGVCKPEIILRTALDSLQKANLVSEEAFRKRGNCIYNELFGEVHNYYTNESMRGDHYKQVEKFKDKIQKLIEGAYNRQRITTDIQKLREAANKLSKPKHRNENDEYDDLGHYSPWLKHFTISDFEQEIEIPGQYTGNGMPLLQYHVKLTAFDPDVLILSSKWKPIQIKMLGSDTKEYKFLIKYGEDLRQDQRIEQMFKLMNNILAENPLCNRQKLKINTFEVIPLNTTIGLIEWVDNTKELKKFVISSMQEVQRKRLSSLQNDYDSWLRKTVSGKSDKTISELYAKAAEKYDKVKTVSNYRSLVNQVPCDALRKSFSNVSADIENLFALKQRFLKSYSVMCLSNWLLGIGDRHLSNILISLRTGEVVGIDFGLAFGTATEQLPVPELVPFRLTPQIVNVTLPHGVSGIFRETMIHALQALKDKKDALCSTLNVFIQEPTMDWLEHEEIGSECVWRPLQKIAVAKSKFEGANPCHVMINEVSNRAKDSNGLKGLYLEFLRGNENENFRATVKGDDLSVKDQVKCLLDQATDDNLLGRMYYGWEAWI